MSAAPIARATETRAPTKDALPVELMERLLVGESPIRIWRKHRGMTQEALSKSIGVAQGFVSGVKELP